MIARVTLPVGEEHEALMVLKDALVLGGQSPTVYVIDPAGDDPTLGTVRPVPVTLGVAFGALIEISGPLQPGPARGRAGERAAPSGPGSEDSPGPLGRG